MKTLKILSAVALAAALFFPLNASRAHAYDLQHARAQKDLSPALQHSLQDKLSDVSGPYFDEQDEKKAKGQIYIDLMQKFEYLPTYGPHNHLVVSCKLGGVEYNPVETGNGQGPRHRQSQISGLHLRARERPMGLSRQAQVGNAEPRRRGRGADAAEPRSRRAAQSRDGKNRADPRRRRRRRSRPESSRPRGARQPFLTSLVRGEVGEPNSARRGGATPDIHPATRLTNARYGPPPDSSTTTRLRLPAWYLSRRSPSARADLSSDKERLGFSYLPDAAALSITLSARCCGSGRS